MDVKADFRSYHVILSGNGTNNTVQAEATIFAYLPLFLNTEDII